MEERLSLLSEGINQMRNGILCPICLEILSDPTSTRCNHHFCSHCVKKLFRTRATAPCPVCSKSLSRRSFAKDNSSIRDIISAVQNVIEALYEDTGIDFTKEPVLPPSARESSGDYHKEPITPAVRGNSVPLSKSVKAPDDTHSSHRQRKDTEESFRDYHKEPIRSAVRENSIHLSKSFKAPDYTQPSNPQGKDADRWANRYAKQYRGKRSTADDSFMFPADIIHPGPRREKKMVTPIERVGESIERVGEWLTENEGSLNIVENMSILYGSLPKKAVPASEGLNLSSDEELSSFSQLQGVIPNPTPLNDIAEVSDDSPVVFEDEERESQKAKAKRDPFEFVSSQKLAEELKTKIPQKTFSKKGVKKPPLLSISTILLEKDDQKYKGEKRLVTDMSFQAPPTINDTFDQLLTENKKLPHLQTTKKGKKSEKIEDKLEAVEGVCIFKSQTDRIASWEKSSSPSNDFSSDSGEEWSGTVNQNQKGKTRPVINLKSEPTQRRATRKSVELSREKKKEDEIVEDINKTFQEVDNHKLMTASQVDREVEEINKKIEVQSEEERTSNVQHTSKSVKEADSQGEDTDIEGKIEEINSADENTRKSKSNHSLLSSSQGWSRVRQLKKDLNESKKTFLKPLNVSADSLKKSKTFLDGEKKSNGNIGTHREEVLCKSTSSSEKLDVDFCEGEKETPTKKQTGFTENLGSLFSPQLLRRCASNISSPGEPVKFLCASQRTHKVNSMEKKLDGSSDESNIFVEEHSLLDQEALVAEACEKRVEVSHPDIPLESSESVVLATMQSLTDREENVRNKTSPSTTQKDDSLHLVSGSEKTLKMSHDIAGYSESSQNSRSSLKDKIVPHELKTSFMSSSVHPRDRGPHNSSIGGLVKADSQSCKFVSDENKKQNYSLNSNTLGSQLLENSKGSMVVSQEDLLKQNFDKLKSPSCAAGMEKSKNSPLDDIPCSLDPFKSSEKSSEDFPVRQESKREVCVMFLKASNFSHISLRNFPFVYLGSCMTQSEHHKAYDKWLIKKSSSMPKCSCKRTTSVYRKGTGVQVPINVTESSVISKGHKVIFYNKEIDKHRKKDSQKSIKEVQSQQPLHFQEISEIIELNSQKINADFKNTPEVACSLPLPEKLLVGINKRTSDENSENISIPPGQILITKDSGPNSGEVVSSSLSFSGKPDGQRKRVRRLLSENSDEESKQSCGSPEIKRKDEFMDNSAKDPGDCDKMFKTPPLKRKKQLVPTDDDLNSEELMKKVLDNINKDLGVDLETKKKRSARKRIRSDSDDEKEERNKKINCLSADDPFYTVTISSDSEEEKIRRPQDSKALHSAPRVPPKPINDLPEKVKVDEDLFEDVDNIDNETEMDMIEGTPVADKSSTRVSMGREKTVLSSEEGGPSRSVKCMEFILPHSSKSIIRSELAAEDEVCERPKPSELSTKKPPSVPCGSNSKNAVSAKMVSLTEQDESGVPKVTTKLARNLFGTPNQSKLSPAKPCPQKKVGAPGKESEKNLCRLGPDLLSPPNMLFVCSLLTPSKVAQVKTFARVIGAAFSDTFTVTMTHLIVNVDENRKTQKTLKYLQAVAAGKWIVSFDWVMASASAQKILPEEDYEALDPLGMDGPRRSRLGPGNLFKNVHFCFIGPFEDITVDKLQGIAMMCGGVYVDKPKDFSTGHQDIFRLVVLGNDAEVDETECQRWLVKHNALAVMSDWVMDSVSSHCLQVLLPFFLTTYSIDQAAQCGVPEDLLAEEDFETSAGISEEYE